jgi:Domain of unknown function (DUF4381)
MNADWLTQLAPARAPAPPSWWPPAVGWWVVVGLILALAAASILWWRFSAGARRRRVRRAAIAELNRIRSLDETDRAPEIQRLMRRYAITAYGTTTVANLSGDAWLRFVQTHGGTGFAGTHGERFLAAAFGKVTPASDTDWSSAAEAFIRHRPPRAREP